ncbi:MAG: phage protein Gp36 family protein [Candidatus Kapaibacterium sp.]
MAYSTDADLLKEMSEEELAMLTGDPEGLAIDYERIARARAMGDAVIDSYLHGRIDSAAATGDPMINKISCDLTIAGLYDFAYRASAVPNTIVWRKINAMKALKDYKAGEISPKGSIPGRNSPPPMISIRKELKNKEEFSKW